jgi:solute carrier family 13 (sodium-dependent dicarboxylate transporter), member 2/3/5
MTDTAIAGEQTGFGRIGRWVGLILGPALALGLQLIPPPDGLPGEAWWVVSLALLMVTWWITEAIPIPATALLPIVVLPLAGAATLRQAAAPYADPIIYLFIGGFILAAAVERWRLHERIALSIAVQAGGRPAALVAGFMAASALLSMWISNTATTLMLTPIAIGAACALSKDGKADLALGGALVLGVAHAATIGGVGTPVGTPTNLIGIAFLERAGESVSFVDWMSRAVPLMLLMLPLSWLLLSLPLLRRPRGDGDSAARAIRESLASLGRVTIPELRVAGVFAVVAAAWMSRPMLTELPGLSGLSDPIIALLGAMTLFVIPSGRGKGEALMNWASAERIHWGIIILFGGGLSLAAGMEATGLAQWIGARIAGLDGVSAIGLIAILVIVTLLVSELASNIATLTSMLPVVGVIAAATEAPLLPLVFPVAIAASFAFMLPVATAPNAIAYASGVVTLKRMLSVGIGLNIAAVILIVSSAAF